MTSLNLFATRFDQVLSLIEKRVEKSPLDYVMIDTPGQIEVFTWSASGSIITQSLAATMPTVLCYVVDTPRTNNPVTFMSNMLYACSIMYKTKLPFIIVFNKIDVVSHDFAVEWMRDFMKFEEAMEQHQDESYMATLTRSMSMVRVRRVSVAYGVVHLSVCIVQVLDEFYSNIRCTGVSSATGEGMDDLFEQIALAAEEYEQGYQVELQQRRDALQREQQAKADASMDRLREDLRFVQRPLI